MSSVCSIKKDVYICKKCGCEEIEIDYHLKNENWNTIQCEKCHTFIGMVNLKDYETIETKFIIVNKMEEK